MNKIDLSRVDLNLLLTFDVLMRERSVTRAAKVLHRTQSAVSHALGRLRSQLNDPLLVKVNGRMEPSEYAKGMVGEVRQVLQTIERVLSPYESFSPAQSQRTLRVVLPDFPGRLFSVMHERIRREAPAVNLEWLSVSEKSLQILSEGEADLALLPLSLPQVQGVECEKIGDLAWACGMRRGHPAIADWNLDTWINSAHVMVRLGDRLHNPMAGLLKDSQRERRVAVIVPNFAAIPRLLVTSDLIATLPEIALRDMAEGYPLDILPTPMTISSVAFGMYWSARHGHEAAINWFRAIVRAVFADLFVSI